MTATSGCPIHSRLHRNGWDIVCGSKRPYSALKAFRSLTFLFLALTTFAQAPTPKPTLASFAYDRQIVITPVSALNNSPYACAVLDASVFAHTNATLADLRLFDLNGRDELPYAVTLSRTEPSADPAHILNLGLKSPRELSFDLAMPQRPYSGVDLTLNAQNFLANARVTGRKSLTDRSPTFLGTFTLFDLSGQHLGGNSSLAIAESTFPYLHIDLTLTPAPGNDTLSVTPAMVAGAEVPPSRQAQTVFSEVAQSFAIAERPRETVATFPVAAHVPIERISFVLDPAETSNFSRPVTVTATPSPSPATQTGEAPAQPEQLSGNISRVDLLTAGQQIHSESLSFPAILGANAQSPATVEVAIQNGDDRPLKIRSVTLEMRQRKLCFSPTGETAILAYGAPNVAVPVYDFERIFNPAGPFRPASLGHERLNPQFVAPPAKQKSLTERYPQLLWIALVLVVSLLSLIAFRSAKRLPR
jgi:hypothetical protein